MHVGQKERSRFYGNKAVGSLSKQTGCDGIKWVVMGDISFEKTEDRNFINRHGSVRGIISLFDIFYIACKFNFSVKMHSFTS